MRPSTRCHRRAARRAAAARRPLAGGRAVHAGRGARSWPREPWLVFACGRYEGIDERVRRGRGDADAGRAARLGDYVLNGGEVAALVDRRGGGPAAARRPRQRRSASPRRATRTVCWSTRSTPSRASWRGREVPPVLLSGHHGQVRRWRRDEQLRRTAARRPDLVAALDPEQLDAATSPSSRPAAGPLGPGSFWFRPGEAVADWTTVPPAGHPCHGGERLRRNRPTGADGT